MKLTKRRQKWVSQRKPDILRGDPITPSAAVAARYQESLRALIDEMITETEKQIRALFKEDHAEEYFGQDASISSQARILTNSLLKHFNERFAKKAKPIAMRLARQSNKASSGAVNSSIQKLTGGLSLPTAGITKEMKDILNATITENVGLIKSISQRYLSQMQGAVMRSITTVNHEDLTEFFAKQKKITYRHASLMALDQTRKAMNNLSSERMQRLGLESFEWLHTGGSDTPREDHVHMNGNIYRFDKPPVIDKRTGERGLPGQAINCRCRMRPVVKFK